MRKTLTFALAGAMFAAGFCADLAAPFRAAVPGGSGGLFTAAEAQTPRAVDRRVSRRTARRTTRRVEYRNSLPAGCVRRPPYWYCGGVYYNSVVQGGQTVYVIVTP